jgi:hypothetical protein
MNGLGVGRNCLDGGLVVHYVVVGLLPVKQLLRKKFYFIPQLLNLHLLPFKLHSHLLLLIFSPLIHPGFAYFLLFDDLSESGDKINCAI